LLYKYAVRRIYNIHDKMKNECGAIGGMRIDRGDRGMQRIIAQMTVCPPQILHNLTWY
jgi:urease alpha subunit